MDASTFHLSLDHLAGQGVVLSTEHSVALQSSLLLLQNSQEFARLRFWGKILGSGVADYYIAQAYATADALSPATTFYSQDCVSWAMLQPVHPVLAAACGRVRTRFTGNPSTEVLVTEPGPGPEEARPELPAEVETRHDALQYIICQPSTLYAALSVALPHKHARMNPVVAYIARYVLRLGWKVAAMRAETARDDGSTVITTTITEDKRLAATIAAIDSEVAIVPRGALKLTATEDVQVNGSFAGA